MPAALTNDQLRARDIREVSVALEAGAGCGKTHVLTARYLSHLEPEGPDAPSPAELDQIIAITFTDAAAREMRQRIRRTCFENLQTARTEAEEATWQRLLRAIDAARVSTIHAFCTSLLRAHAAEAGLDPLFGVLDQGDADVLQYQAIDDVLRGRLEERDDDALALADTFGLSRVKQQLAELLAHRDADNWQRWLCQTPDEVVAAWREEYDRVGPEALREIGATPEVDEILALLGGIRPEKPLFQEARAALLELLPKLKSGTASPDELTAIGRFARAKSVDGPYICTAKDWGGDKARSARYSKACEALRKNIDRCALPPWNADRAREAAELGLALLRLASAVADEYQQRKDAQGLLDFDDQLARAHGLLTGEDHADLRRRLAERVRMVLVDEFQDTDELQVELVKALCGPETGRLFFVGDFKQSIYRFRGAEPNVFLRLKSEVEPPGRLGLTINFRSQPAILHFVNALFCSAIEEYEPLQAERAQRTAEPSVEFLWTVTPEKNTKQKDAARKARRREAAAIARRLRELLDPRSEAQPVVDKQSERPRRLEPGDVAILFRTLSDVRIYEEALRAEELDYYLVGGHAFYAQQEIYDVLNLLRAVASSADEVSLAGALRSPLFALADETLFWLVEHGGTLNGGLLAAAPPPQLEPVESAKVSAAADTLRHLRAMKDRVPIATLVGEALERTAFDSVLVAEFLGERKLANLQKLVEEARAADHGGVLELDGFITQLAQFVAREPREALAATCPETANVIRLMTIHHAKGLEFPLVVIPDLDRPPLILPPPAALDKELGPVVDLPREEEEAKSATGMSLFAARERRAELAERRRLLYVATTRAADYLILSSSLEALDKPRSDWMSLLAERFDLATGMLQAELPADYARPHVRVMLPADVEPKDGKTRGPDLVRVVEDARQLASEGGGLVPREVAPIGIDRGARRQFSFSRLTGRLVRSDLRASTAPDIGGASDEAAIDPRGFGSLVHAVLERIKFPADDGRIRSWCEQLAAEHVLRNAELAAAEAARLIEKFTASPRAGELARAVALVRETEFLLAWPPHGYLQGYLDCLYRDSRGGWHLVDYKTNDVPSDAVTREAGKYELQLYVYAMAVEQALSERPVELAVHFLRPGVEHSYAWNDAARDRAIELVNEAIAESIRAVDLGDEERIAEVASSP